MAQETTAPTAPSIVASMAASYNMAPANFEATLRATVVPANTTREEFAAFLIVAQKYGLNPITREIYAFPKKGGGIQPIVGVDGWMTIINSHPQFDGMTFEDHIDSHGTLLAITCRMYRKDRTHPIEAIEYLIECQRSTEPWNQWPRRMLRHKAAIQAARYAFGYSGIYDPDEAERARHQAPPEPQWTTPAVPAARQAAALPEPRPAAPEPGPAPAPAPEAPPKPKPKPKPAPAAAAGPAGPEPPPSEPPAAGGEAFDPVTGELPPLPGEISIGEAKADGSHFTEWCIKFAAAINTANTLMEIEGWLQHNVNALAVLDKEAPKLHTRVRTTIARRRADIQAAQQ